MKSTLVIARRELTEKRFVFVSAIAFALLTLIVPFLPGVHAGERRNALVIASLGWAVIFTMGLAAILGSTIIGRELSDGRLSFYFSKPVPANSIWFGKLIAALVLLGTCFAIIALPAIVAGSEEAVRTWTNSPRDARAVVGIVLALAAAFFLLSHVIGTFVRSRSAWLVFDFIALAVCGTAVWLLARPLLLGFAIDLIRTLALILGLYTAVTIIAAGAWQVARGRTDRKRSHMELSRFLWMSLGCGLLVMAAFVAWVVSVSLTQVKPDFVQQASNGSWAMIAGKTAHRNDYRAAFLYNVADGRSVRLSSLQPWWGTTFSADGKSAAWFVPSPGASELYVARLDVPMPTPTPAPRACRMHRTGSATSSRQNLCASTARSRSRAPPTSTFSNTTSVRRRCNGRGKCLVFHDSITMVHCAFSIRGDRPWRSATRDPARFSPRSLLSRTASFLQRHSCATAALPPWKIARGVRSCACCHPMVQRSATLLCPAERVATSSRRPVRDCSLS